MKHCPECHADLKGEWSTCPLCESDLKVEKCDEREETDFPDIPLRFNRKKIRYILSLASVLITLLYFIAHFIWRFEFFNLEYVLFGIMIMWLMMVVIVRKRRNIVKGIAYILFLISIISLYFDYINGWLGWSLTFVIPIVCVSALLSMFISIQLVNLKAKDYILYLQLAAIIGLIPAVFLILDWVVFLLPSLLSVLLSLLMSVAVFFKHRRAVISELEKRMHV
ncbi:MAG: DUF6320 domain-containing protein [Alkalibacterium sp.]|uniref:DUF6320 domain-containing protein n=1 Tax=Alkalibacterium TaxID=99906 RepID=UPI000EC3095F|nr:DUF6320 domain-containing protein [Alkalibacterium sp.]MDN6293317.1 DUF6320 domain-containing protein [Alkalibacterium sp.]MDN6294902.1 DUF6320 domain-containing protein [Alkalibacterium sp.]MDN6326540.1 DUF6320 domain-containing protein [Alkalibacterium sp.]MDN6385306.1 DUF6320 domain-containing protein [Alkalibacterium sp.]MDN6398234.1 DUF6320 domain-containing protein [Alkalibacterium sp.]